MTVWADTGQSLTKAEEAELRRLNGKHRDIATHGIGAMKRMAAKLERQLRMAAFVDQHGIACFKCGGTFHDWVKTGISGRGPWALCLNCVREKKEA